jgi:protein-S-isoprenylcysteine O-methyltransferase Ste14
LLTLYFWFGSQLEDRKLIAYYGDKYLIYTQKVYGIFPLPWRYLSIKEADDIQSNNK